jgi:2-amino-4,5-dihydroxy-6-oxo-7-(phosphonooxy)heptanoate synthase
MNQVVRACPIPVLAAGGSKKTGPAETAMFTRDVLRSGAKGLAMGRNIFEADNPVETVKAVAHVFNDTKELIELDWR